jgi:hypothetical protein
MDKPTRPGNPLTSPPDEVLRAAIGLENDASFRVIAGWIGSCYGNLVNRLPLMSQEIDFRWSQGQAQALLLITKALIHPREELRDREAKAKESQLPRNV